MSRDEKVVRWGLNTLARLGTKDCADSVERAVRRYQEVPEIVAAAVSALARLRMGQLSGVAALRGVAPEVQMLAAMQTVDPARLAMSGLEIDIAKVDPEILKLALIVVGLDRDVQHLLHPRYENGVIVRELGQHDDPIVRQYAVWAVIENHRLTFNHLGIDLARIEEQPANVQSKLLQLGASSLPDLNERHDLILQGSDLPDLDAREGLAKGLLHTYYDGLAGVTLEWFDTDGSDRVRLHLAEHFARYSDEQPSYHEKALELTEAGSNLRDRVLLGAEGKPLFGEIKKAEGQASLSFFNSEGDEQMRQLQEAVRMMNRTTVLVLNATPDDLGRIRADKEGALLERQLEMVKNREREMHVVQKFAVRLQDIQKELLNNRPKILHFSGHGDEGVLAFEKDNGTTAVISGEVLAEILEVYGDLECLVLHACYTENVARACANHVQVIVGSTDAINDETAPKFTYAFYQALANGRPYENAFRAGQVEVRTVSMEAAACYKLFTR
ncbi:MAG: CHAT domain-containing protein [Spiribacter salinus]|uniref:CHAT domain-containing protein n=1 Tax=Spiribacter salinus TaxID=1335746 RepID=A0A540VQC6_9GAMM|nr:MAG: CHAT domain-containing protein [Spiribacter salinus]